jgi:hypothetical protein
MKIRYYDADKKSYVSHEGKIIRSGAGAGAEPEYGVLYQLTDGRYLGGVRRRDRGDLMTEVRYADNERDAMPARWAIKRL